jgi:hypothetical protein
MGVSNVNATTFSVVDISFIGLVHYEPHFSIFPVPHNTRGLNEDPAIKEPVQNMLSRFHFKIPFLGWL